eukprot:PhF_6_TR25678/c0_g1_i1/m.36182/K03321/TC.SULP; sulfate permease, SulP family
MPKAFIADLCTPFDARYEDLRLPGTTVVRQVMSDVLAGIVIALVAIPMNMGFSIASGVSPVMGLSAGIISSALGAFFGGSKYQVYGPTAAFIPVIYQIVAEFKDADTPEGMQRALGGLGICSIISGLCLCIMALLKYGSIVQRVPHCVVVGFTIGIAIAIVMSELGDVLGLRSRIRPGFFEKLEDVWNSRGEINFYCFSVAATTFLVTKIISTTCPLYVPAPILGLLSGTLLATMVWPTKNITSIEAKFGPVPSTVLSLTYPAMPNNLLGSITLMFYSVVGIVLVSAIESLLCSKMADRMANNTRTQFQPNKELFGQGLVQLVMPFVNGYPCTGALARTATNIKVGAISPLAGIVQAFCVALFCWLFAAFLGKIPLSAIGGILLYVATNMMKKEEVEEVWASGRTRPRVVMVVTAIFVFTSDFLHGVVAGIVLYFFWGGAAPDHDIDEDDQHHFAASPHHKRSYGGVETPVTV